MFCERCGKQNDDTSRFCRYCGAPLGLSDTLPDNIEDMYDGYGEEPEEQQFDYNETGSSYDAGYGSSAADYSDGYDSYDSVNEDYARRSSSTGAGEKRTRKTAEKKAAKKPADQKKSARKRKRFLKNYIPVFILAAVFVVLIIVALNVGKKQFSAEKTAQKYMEAVLNADWDTAYDYLNVREVTGLTKDDYTAAKSATAPVSYQEMTATDETALAQNYVDQASDYMDELGLGDLGELGDMFADAYSEYEDTYNEATGAENATSVVVEYYTSSGTQTAYVTMEKAGKKWLFFDDWKVSADSTYGTDIELTVPAGSTVLLNGAAPSGAAVTNDDGTEDVYTIPALFYGTYQLEISQEDMEPYTEAVEYDGYENLYYGDLKLVPDADLTVSLTKQFGNDFQKYLSAAFAGSDFSAVQDLFTADAVKNEKVQPYYKNIQDDLYTIDRGYGIIDIELDSISIDFDPYSSISDQKPTDIVMTVKCNYNAEWYYSDSGDVETEKYEDSFMAAYAKENGTWKLKVLEF